MKSCLCTSGVEVVFALLLHRLRKIGVGKFEICNLAYKTPIYFSDVVRWCLVYSFGVIMRFEEQDFPFRYLF